MSASRRSTAYTLTALAVASFALPSVAQAHHWRHRPVAKPMLLPAHEKPGYPEAARAALMFPIDVGLTPVLPVDGLVLK